MNNLKRFFLKKEKLIQLENKREFRSCHSDPPAGGEESLANASSETSSEILRRSTPQDDRKCETRKHLTINYFFG